MRGDSGTVSVNYLNKAFFSIVLLAGCSTVAADSKQAEQLWLERFDYCSELSEQNKLAFPKSDWFESLPFEDKKSVVGYIANYNDRECMKEQTAKFKRILEQENNKKLLDFYSVDLTPLDDIPDDRMDSIDKGKLKELQKQFNQPFNLRFVIQEQNLYPPK